MTVRCCKEKGWGGGGVVGEKLAKFQSNAKKIAKFLNFPTNLVLKEKHYSLATVPLIFSSDSDIRPKPSQIEISFGAKSLKNAIVWFFQWSS